MPEGLGRTSLDLRAVGSGSLLTLLLLDKKRAWDARSYPAGRRSFSSSGDPFGPLISRWHDSNSNEDHSTCVILAAAPAHDTARLMVLQGIKCFLHHGRSARIRYQKPPSAFKAGSCCPGAFSFLVDRS